MGALNIRCRIFLGAQKRDHNFDNHPYRVSGLGFWDVLGLGLGVWSDCGLRVQGLGLDGEHKLEKVVSCYVRREVWVLRHGHSSSEGYLYKDPRRSLLLRFLVKSCI